MVHDIMDVHEFCKIHVSTLKCSTLNYDLQPSLRLSHKTRDFFLVSNCGNIKLTTEKTENRKIYCSQLLLDRFSDSSYNFHDIDTYLNRNQLHNILCNKCQLQ